MSTHDDQNLSQSTLRISIADMMALRVRTREAEDPPPEALYQRLPVSVMAVMMTIPCGTAAVSIPQQNGRYPISKNSPAGEDTFVVVYARKPNSRYEAIEVLFQGNSFGIAPFREFARRWVEKNEGGLMTIEDRHAYFAPSREQWGVILRDGGFTAIDPSSMVFEITPEIMRSRMDPLSSGVLVRVPVHCAKKLRNRPLLPAFARVELTLDPRPGPDSRWISFVEFQRERASRSRPPNFMIPEFREWLKELARECGFKCWVFRRGMYFGDHIEWWGHKNRRRTLHEGIDFAEGLLPDSSVQSIPEGIPVRAIADGEIIAFLDDSLNKTVLVRHPSIKDEHGDVFHTLFSHIHPIEGTPGHIMKSQVLGNVNKSKTVGAPAHLHLTGTWIPESIHASEITIDHISTAFMPIVLVNFNGLISSG